jgi:hypothetical protein
MHRSAPHGVVLESARRPPGPLPPIAASRAGDRSGRHRRVVPPSASTAALCGRKITGEWIRQEAYSRCRCGMEYAKLTAGAHGRNIGCANPA